MICRRLSGDTPSTSTRKLSLTERWPSISAKWKEGTDVNNSLFTFLIKCSQMMFINLNFFVLVHYICKIINTCIIHTCAYCRKEDGTLRTMNAEKLLKTLPVLQSQLDALLEFDCTANDLTNGVINMAFMLLFRDLIRLFACYNDGIINLLGNAIQYSLFLLKNIYIQESIMLNWDKPFRKIFWHEQETMPGRFRPV